MAAVEWKIQRAGEVSLFYLLNNTSTISWARVKFSLSFLTERFNFQAHPYLKKLLVEILSMRVRKIYDLHYFNLNATVKNYFDSPTGEYLV